VDVLPQKSLAVHVLVCVRAQPSLVTLPSLEVTVGMPQASVAVAVPSAASISPAKDYIRVMYQYHLLLSTGGVRSAIQFTVRDAVDVLPQKSLAVHVLVCVRRNHHCNTAIT
jgi:hypothetical protein